MPTTHPQELLPAYVLGALDPGATRHVREHLAVCPQCRAEADSFRALIAAPPHAPGAAHPPAHLKHQILARIAADRRRPGCTRVAAVLQRWVRRRRSR